MQICKRIAIVLALLVSTVLVYAAASYPTSVVTFSTRSNGQTIDASWFNTIQDEIVAIEGGLINGLAHDLKFTDALFDIGKSGATRPRDLFLSRNAVVGGTLGVTGASTIAGLTATTGAFSGALSATTGTFSGALSATTGAFTGAITATGGQIAFPATQVASATANTLDDYEEGTWTPVIGGSGGTSGQTYTTQAGRYIKIGKHVTCTGNVVLSAKGTITTAVQIQGLPFTAVDTTTDADVGGGQIHYFANMTTNWISLGAVVTGNSTTAVVYGLGSAKVTADSLVTGDIANTTAWIFTINYEAAN